MKRSHAFHCIFAKFSNPKNSSKWCNDHVRVGGKGPAVVLLHGVGDTGVHAEKVALKHSTA
jgi:hypothetical protein